MIKTNCTYLEKDLTDIIRLFGDAINTDIEVNIFADAVNIRVDVLIDEYEKQYISKNEGNDLKKESKYFSKACLYKSLSEYTGKNILWGSLTGIRPVSLYNSILKEKGELETDSYFSNFFDVQPEKLQLLKTISSVQAPYYNAVKTDVDLYVGIPFCKGRCSYCSFFSADIDASAKFVEPYINALLKEIESAKKIIDDNRYFLRSIYIGGGTPSSLPLHLLEKLLSSLSGLVTPEFTVEAGRADSITDELLNLLEKYYVSRISINAQTSNDETLVRIGRNHTFKDVIEAFDRVKNRKFIINTDIIAGLPGECEIEFYKTLTDVAKLNPENITIHTLSLKKGSSLAQQNYRHSGDTELMLTYAQSYLAKEKYFPYYMYRQKYAAGNLENVGYSKAGTECVYNIDNMDDSVSILACGANAISKKVFENGRIERIACPKDVQTYINKVDILNEEKYKLFSTF